MFDIAGVDVADLPHLTDADLIDAARGWSRAENAACARKLAAMAEIFARRTGLTDRDREWWWIDPDAAVAAELSAALNITTAMALHHTHRGVALRDRLPQVAALFDTGLISQQLVRAIITRTDLITEATALAAVDTELAHQITSWGPQSVAATERAIDATVTRHDPGALRRARDTAHTQDLHFGSPADTPGFTTLWARMLSGDATLIEKILTELAHTVCARDPRTPGQRLTDALTARITDTELVCGCDTTDCDATRRTGPTKNTTIYIITDPTTHNDGADDSGAGGDDHGNDGDEGDGGDDGGDGGGHGGDGDVPDPDRPDPQTGTSAEPNQPHAPATGRAAQQCRPTPPPCPTPKDGPARSAFVFGAGIMPTPLLAELTGRTHLRTVQHPGDAPPEPRYTPSRTLADYIRCRDLTCRFPGCDKPATDADIDHTIPYPHGPTHASNLKALCRFHHLLKTFWNGENGWHDQQLPDATIIWTSPTGHTYRTRPGSATLFPTLCQPTPALWDGDPPTTETTTHRSTKMPRRRHTRATNRARTIAAERKLNDEHATQQTRPPPF